MIGLGNCDNTSDASKPISTLTQNALDLKADQTSISNIDNTSDANKPVSNATQTALDLKADQTSISNIDNTSDANKPVSNATQTALDLKADQTSISNIDNTSDANKPVSNATQTALDLKANQTSISNIDNTSDANKPVSNATQTALDLKAPLSNPTFTGTVEGITKAMIDLGNCDNTSDASKPISTLTQNALDAINSVVLERFNYFCSGQSHTTRVGGTSTITDVTANQTMTTSYATITGSNIDYLPPTTADLVIYKFTFSYRGEDASTILFIKCFLDGTEMTIARNSYRFQGNYTDTECIVEIPIQINGLTDDIANATLNTWLTTAKNIHIEARDYDTSYDVILHEASIFRADNTTTTTTIFIKPMIEITAIKY
jgi:hypothetical protein